MILPGIKFETYTTTIAGTHFARKANTGCVPKISPFGLELVEISVKTVLSLSPDPIQKPTKQQ
jgi:hypothetical protein